MQFINFLNRIFCAICEKLNWLNILHVVCSCNSFSLFPDLLKKTQLGLQLCCIFSGTFLYVFLIFPWNISNISWNSLDILLILEHFEYFTGTYWIFYWNVLDILLEFLRTSLECSIFYWNLLSIFWNLWPITGNILKMFWRYSENILKTYCKHWKQSETIPKPFWYLFNFWTYSETIWNHSETRYIGKKSIMSCGCSMFAAVMWVLATRRWG